MAAVLIRGGKVIDGSGNPWFYGDVLIEGERVAAVMPPGIIDPGRADRVVGAEGMIVSPGFIDIQSHSIVPLLRDPRCLSKITQGVTTEIMGEAWTPAPVGGRNTEAMNRTWTSEDLQEWVQKANGWTRFGDWLNALGERGVSPNVGSFLGGGTLRKYGRGMDMGDSSPEEIECMRRAMRESMEDGAFGVSYALIYPPDSFTSTDELVRMCQVVAEFGGVYITHIRSEEGQLIEALGEAIAIGERAQVPVEIYHLKAAGAENWHKMPDAIALINAARERGVDITADMYPYAASGTGLSSVLPPWASEGGRFYDNLRDPEMRARLRAEVLNPSPGWESMGSRGAENIMPVGFEQEHNRQYAGKRLAEIAEARNEHWVDTVLNLLADEGQRISTIYFSMTEDNLGMQLRQPWIKISTDAGGVDPAWAAAGGPTHPRAYGTYPRVLRKYVREEGVLTWEDAIRKMTSAAADRLGLRDRGMLRPGVFADVVVLDPVIVGDRSTFEEPHQLSVGVRDVWVNGQQVLVNGIHTGATPGVFLKGPGAR